MGLSRMAAGPVFRGMDRKALTAAYNNSAAVADSPEWLATWRNRSAALREQPQVRLDIRYGAAPRALLDYFHCGAVAAPLFVFLHGGYWQRNSRDMFSFVAAGALAHGIDVAVVGYTLAPEATLDGILGEAASALDMLQARQAEFGFDAGRIILGGWSAGGHLAAALLARGGLYGGLAISGIFDLEPIALCELNDKLSLDADAVERLSPQRRLVPGQPPLRLVVGGDELPEIKRQSADYVAAANAAGLPVTMRQLDGLNHFSILDELYRPDGALVVELRQLMGRR